MTIYFRTCILLLFFAESYCLKLEAQTFESKIESIISKEFNDPNGPGGVFLITKNGETIFQKATGKANLELKADLNANSVFQIGSMTKQFTAIAILILEENGKLEVSDKVSKYIKDYPNGDSISIHQLLTHTSGIKDFTRMRSISDIAQKEMSPSNMVDFFKNEPVDFKPGERFEYNNSGYVLLGYIIELVSGQKYEDFIQENIFKKANMTHSGYASDRKIIVNRASGYHKKEYGYVNKTMINFGVPFSAGSLISTVDDMLKWQNALNKNLIINDKSSKKAFSRYKLNSGEAFDYGYGWHLLNENGIEIREHGGSIFGFKSMGVYLPSKDIYVIGLSNCDCNSPTQVVRDMAELAGKVL
ncbi:class A beta-lactamase-related serine hydrolase [Lacihabitans sp. LS3-19]|uniref:serine hydrolase domain-containing protein n=1 Tax=Lacihabitans sp. LS3-19 TaxID=2487335 RepID=UPI0020CE39B0|nr:serine hydrolase domain-containing protein [Lacihabitans sp. LS3-19]MCP9767221.1 class A beta-lactamase-related serine hydrolase [Lacihabitans sp. LS3-19]